MDRRPATPIPLLVPALLLGLATALAGATAGRSQATADDRPWIGFRGDGTGVWPADCTPVTTWNETAFKKVKEGRETKLEPTGPDPKNLVWKKELINYCNGGMIVAGGKLFLLRDRGGVGFAFDHVPSFLGEELVCLDPADGKELWKADLHHLDVLPQGVQQEVTKTLREQIEYYPRVFGAHKRWYSACWQRSKKPAPPKAEHEKLYAEAAAEYRKYVPAVPATLAEQRAAGKEWKASGYIQCMFWGIEKKYLKESGQRRKLLKKYGYGTWNAWFGQGSFVGSAMATPVSDGKRLWVTTMHGDAFCYDFEGKCLWKKWYGYDMTRGEAITSPILVGGLLVMRGRMREGGKGKWKHCWMAVDRGTGKLVWQTPKRGGKSYTDASPTHHRLPVDGGTDHLDVLWCPSGQVLRAADGKELATEIGCQGNGRPWAVQGDVLVIANGSSDGGAGKAQTWPEAVVAFRLVAKGKNAVAAEKLWLKEGKRDKPCRLTARDGILYCYLGKGGGVAAYDLLTGEQLAKGGVPRGRRAPHHLTAIAGRYLFGLHHDGWCLVHDLGPDGRQLKLVGENLLGTRAYKKYDFFNEGAQPCFSGNRIFIRNYTEVYCLGDPKAKMVLSAAHR